MKNRWGLVLALALSLESVAFADPAPSESACPPVAMTDGETCYQPWSQLYFSGEYLLWWTRGSATSPLVTTGPVPPGPLPSPFPQPGTVVLHGGERILDGARMGGRFAAGIWFDENHRFGFEGNFLFLDLETDDFAASATAALPLGRPYYNINPRVGVGELVRRVPDPSVGFITFDSGRIDIQHRSELWGGEANFRTNVWCGPDCSLDLLVGWRTLSLDEETRILEQYGLRSTRFNIRGRNSVLDEFKSENTFHGGQVGLAGEHRFLERFFINWTGKLAIGSTHQRVDINGSTTFTGTGFLNTTRTGGFLAREANIGSCSRDVFAVVPEVQVNLGYQILPSCRAFVGYNFLYWSNVAQATEQIDRRINAAPSLGGPPEPSFSWNDSGYWAQGVNFGLALGW